MCTILPTTLYDSDATSHDVATTVPQLPHFHERGGSGIIGPARLLGTRQEGRDCLGSERGGSGIIGPARLLGTWQRGRDCLGSERDGSGIIGPARLLGTHL